MTGAGTDVVVEISESGTTLNAGMLSAIGAVAGSISADEVLYSGYDESG
jgi:ATP phosphoribosyltransferase